MALQHRRPMSPLSAGLIEDAVSKEAVCLIHWQNMNPAIISRSRICGALPPYACMFFVVYTVPYTL